MTTDEIIHLFKNKKLRKEIVQTMKDIYSYAGTVYDNPTEIPGTDQMEEPDWFIAWESGLIFAEANRIDDAFEKFVFNKMPQPHVLTLEEVVELLLNIVNPGEQGYSGVSYSVNFDDVYTIFINCLNNSLFSYRSSKPFPICIVHEGEEFFKGLDLGLKLAKNPELEPPRASQQVGGGKDLLWSKGDIRVSVLGKRYYGGRDCGRLYQLCVCVEGRMSKMACEGLQNQLGRLLPSIVRSASLLESEESLSSSLRSINEIPLAEQALLSKEKVLIRTCLDAYYDEPRKKDSIERRIRNAAHLLVESDGQHNDAVGLALSVAAVEALLGEKGQNLAEKVADNVAVLLEPDLDQRYNATQFAKGLYDLRSRALHGEQIEAESNTRRNARHLAAGALNGIIHRRDFMRRGGFDPEGPQDLLKELRKGRFKAGQPLGIPDSNVRTLWRK